MESIWPVIAGVRCAGDDDLRNDETEREISEMSEIMILDLDAFVSFRLVMLRRREPRRKVLDVEGTGTACVGG